MIGRLLLLALTFSGWTIAQTPQPGQLASDPAGGSDVAAPRVPKTGPGSVPWKRMTVKEKVTYDSRHLFDYDNIIFAGIGAAFDQGRNRPAEWGQGWGAYGERWGSHVGQYLIQRSIMSPVRAIDHEDTRYFRSTRTTFQGRLGDAFLHTIWRHSDDGGMMPAYSEFLGDYGAAAISRMWWPDKYHNGAAIFVAGSNTILIDGAINAFHEFAPDVRHALHMRR
jgi:hypothetical protein